MSKLTIHLIILVTILILWGILMLSIHYKHKRRMKEIEEESAERRRRWELEDGDRMTELNQIRRELENQWPFNIHTDKLSPPKKMGKHTMR